ncbi:MAG: NUDIX domain-containing protein [Waterburya sp.]
MNHPQQTQLISVAVAIIHQEGKYLMQLRDDIPNIAYPGVWGFFGGHIEPEEEPEAALKRELIEEINYRVKQLTIFRCDCLGKYIRHLYSCPLTVPVEELELKEGWDLKLLTPAEIRQGFAYSHKAIADKPLGEIHRKIMLDFITSKVKL